MIGNKPDSFLKEQLKKATTHFEDAIKFLKKKQLDELPYHLVLGPSRAGKTCLLANSELSYLLAKKFSNKALQELEPTEFSDIWVANQGIFLDTSGRFFEKEDSALSNLLWGSFLKLLRKNKSSQK